MHNGMKIADDLKKNYNTSLMNYNSGLMVVVAKSCHVLELGVSRRCADIAAAADVRRGRLRPETFQPKCY